MSEQQRNTGELTSAVAEKAESLLKSVDEFADEFGEHVLHGKPLPARAAEELALMIRYSDLLRHALAALKATG